jgi:hypothetical protein
MKKEAIIAIIFGAFLGAFLSFFFIQKSKTGEIEKLKKIVPTETLALKKKIDNSNFQSLEIVEPENGLIVEKKEINIKLRAPKKSLLVVQSPIKEMILEISQNDISFTFPLALGENVIRIAVYPKNKTISAQEKEIRVYYLEK